MTNNSTGIESFSAKSEEYVKGRPNYSVKALDFLIEKLNLNSSMRVADVGAGTGLLTRDLQRRFREVIAIEPNDDMRTALGPSALNGTAESTGLASESVDAIFAAQAFHWFTPSTARAEFRRVLKGQKPVALLWNDRQTPHGSGAAKLDEIMNSLRPKASQSLEADEIAIAAFFAGEVLNKAEFENSTKLTRESLRAMVLSRSYAPRRDDQGYGELIKRLDELFEDYAEEEYFAVPYKTQVYWGWLNH